MAILSLEQRRQRERADEQANKIRQELAEYDLAHSRDPIDRRRAEKQAEQKALEAHDAEQNRRTENWAAWTDQRIEQHLRRYFMSGDEEHPGLLTTAIGQVIAEERRDRRKEVKTAIEEERQSVDAKLAELEHRLKSVPGKLPVAKSWQPETVVYQSEMVSHKGSLWQAKRDTAQAPGGEDWVCVARHGRDAITPVVRGLFDSNEAYAQLDVVEFEGASYLAKHDNPGVPGHDDGWQVFGSERMDRRAEVKAAIEDERQSVDAKFAELEARLKSSPGKLPVAKTWREESVTYMAEFVSHKGSLYQARKDTAQEPGRGADWICVARHGVDAITPTVRGAFDTSECYAQLDIVSFDGAAYIAKSNNPGLCPGEGWEPLSARGQRGRKGEAIRGPQGERGAKGDKGESTLQIVSWHIDAPNFRAIPFMSNGQPGPELNLRPLFLQLLQEVGSVDYAWGP